MQLYYIILSIVAGIIRGPALLYSLINGSVMLLASALIAAPIRMLPSFASSEAGRFVGRFTERFLINMGPMSAFAIIYVVGAFWFIPTYIEDIRPHYRSQTSVVVAPALHIGVYSLERVARSAVFFDGEIQGFKGEDLYRVNLDPPFPYWYRTDRPLKDIGLGPVIDDRAKSGFVFDDSTWKQKIQEGRIVVGSKAGKLFYSTPTEDTEWLLIVGWAALMATGIGASIARNFWRLLEFLGFD